MYSIITPINFRPTCEAQEKKYYKTQRGFNIAISYYSSIYGKPVILNDKAAKFIY